MNTPLHGQPFVMKPDGVVRTNWQTIGAVIVGTAIVVGGIFSVKADIATAAKDAADARSMVQDIRLDLYRLRVQLGAVDNFSSHPAVKKANP